MTLRDRILAVYRRETPDVVPFMLDLSHWFYHRNRLPWDLSKSYDTPELELLDFHKQHGIGFYLPNLASFYEVSYADDVQARVIKSAGGDEITWEYQTPVGTIRRTRRWDDHSYSWAIPAWGIHSEKELRALGYALSRRVYQPRWDRYLAWKEQIGSVGVAYAVFAYSGMGHLLNYWLGIQGTVNAMLDWPDAMRDVIDQINKNNLLCVDMLAQSPAEVVLVGDNFSSDLQPPAFFNEWSRAYYEQVVRRLHDAGKYVAVHVDGRLRGLLSVFRDIGVDCIDAVTPAPMGDLDPAQCRAEAGDQLILSGGVPPTLWLEDTDVRTFEAAVLRWLDLKRQSPRLIANAGDQVPPHAPEDRIFLMRDLVEQHGRF